MRADGFDSYRDAVSLNSQKLGSPFKNIHHSISNDFVFVFYDSEAREDSKNAVWKSSEHGSG